MAKEVMPHYIPAYSMILLRVSIAAGMFLLVHRFAIREKVTDKKDLLRMFVCGIFGVGANMLLFFKGLENTVPINGAILMTNTPIFVVVIALVWGMEKPSIHNVCGILLASLGATLLLAGKGFQFSSHTLTGDLQVTANAIIYSFYLVYARPLMRKYHPITVSKWTFLFGLLFVFPFGIGGIGQIHWQEIPTQIWVFIVFIILFSTFLTYLLNAWALRKASSSLVGSYIYLQPVLATGIALAFGSDSLTIEKTLYMLLILCGVYLVGRKKNITLPEKASPKAFTEAGEQSKKEKSPKALGNFIIDNAQVGDRIRANDDEYYEVVSRRTNKKGHTETELQHFVKNEETGEFENNPSAVKFFTDKYRGTDMEKLGYRDASDLFESYYTNSKGERIIEQYTK